MAEAVWAKLEKTTWLEILSDAVTPQLAAAVERITSLPIAERIRQSKDLGEVMVLAHAATQADSGHDVVVLVDDGHGAGLAATEGAASGRSV